MWIAIFLAHYRQHHDHKEEVKTLERDLQDAMYKCGCSEAANGMVGDIGDDDIVAVTTGSGRKEDPLIEYVVPPPID